MAVLVVSVFLSALLLDVGGAPVETTCAQQLPGQDYFSADTEDCAVFYKCLGGSWVRQICPASLHFDPLANICSWQYLVRCEICPVPCSPVTGTCDADNALCLCNQGYTGSACTEVASDDSTDDDITTSSILTTVTSPLTTTTSSPVVCSLACENGATCTVNNRSELCECLPGFTGTLCQTFDLCYPLRCENGASCQISGQQAACLCAEGYTGDRCETVLLTSNDSAELPDGESSCSADCLLSGVCVNGTCFCPPGHSGPHCQLDNSSSVSCPAVCQHGGVLVGSEGNVSCDCPLGYSGDFCQTADSCISQPCEHGGQCVHVEGAGATCLCPPGTGGKFCQIESPCADVICLNGGACRESGGGALSCQCPAGFSGNFCEIEATCDDVLCQNGGHCKMVDSQPSCFCLQGTSGPRCQIRSSCTQLGEENLCQNNGTCVDSEQGFVCICPFGFKGNNCQLKRGCVEDDVICELGAVCVDTQRGAQCQYDIEELQCD